MFHGRMKRRATLAVAGVALFGTAVTAAPAQAAAKTVTITWLADNAPGTTKPALAIIAAFQKANPTIKVKLVTRPTGADGDNVVKTKLATGTMEDLFTYNDGALLSALNPAKTMVDVTKAPWEKNVYDSFKPAVQVGKKLYGAPFGAAMGGGLYYNVSVFQKAGITTTPKTWAALITDAKAIKAAGVDPICGTFGDSWTAQLFVLADFYNVHAADPSFASDYTNNKAKYAYIPAALQGFLHLQEAHDLGLYNSDAATAKYTDGVARVASGQCGMYPMLTFATSAIPTDALQNVGFMAQPGNNAKNVGLTTWMPAAAYVPVTTKHRAQALKLQAFIASKAGTSAYTRGGGYQGPYMTKDQAPAPANVPLATKDLANLIKSGKSYPALEFISPIKGPNLPGITVQVATGQVSAKDGANLYDQDVVAQAQQLGLAGW